MDTVFEYRGQWFTEPEIRARIERKKAEEGSMVPLGILASLCRSYFILTIP